ncbi:MAG TPA: class I adenylate-forming enzyme family protein [Alphaproteobacteria bacterium]|nr:class I adenylate-forming enzyme family protein [Alphaproteobacteria bacterium]
MGKIENAGPSAGAALARQSAASTVAGLFAMRARLHPGRIAIEEAGEGNARTLTYAALDERSRRLASALRGLGVGRGDRVAILSENRAEFLELFMGAARIGAIVACQNWRLARPELQHCLNLVEPKMALVSPRYAKNYSALGGDLPKAVVFGDAYEALLADAAPALTLDKEVDPEDALLILYTSGTTGLPKGAVISHRAEIARNLVMHAEQHIVPGDTFAVWSPLFHMGGADYSLAALMSGGKVVVFDGFQKEALVALVGREELGWLILMPGMVKAFIEEFKRQNAGVKGVKVCGVMADLVPPAEIAEATRLVGAPFMNTFGSTETGNPPASAGLIPIGVAPESLSKIQSAYCEVRLVDPDDNDVPDGAPGELAMRGPTLFSGYWRAEETNAQDFRGGWFHMGDVFQRNPDGTLDFVDRVKYLIKTGGENVYPAEIERVMMQEPRVADVAVVRRPDDKWGEVPIAFVARHDESLDADALKALCRAELAGYKQPKGIHFIGFDEFPRSTSGKIQRHELEKLLDGNASG